MFCILRSDNEIYISGVKSELVALASMHLKIMSPVLIVGGIVGDLLRVLISYREFTLPNISPMLMSIVIIGVIMLVKMTTAAWPWPGQLQSVPCASLFISFQKIGNLVLESSLISILQTINISTTLVSFYSHAILSSTVGQIIFMWTCSLPLHLRRCMDRHRICNRVFQFPVGILATAFLVPLSLSC